MKISGITQFSNRIRENIANVIVGKDDTTKLVVTALIAGGHVLLEDVPGTGKTVLSKALSLSLDSSFKRIQFTPDLLPSDITGTNIYNQKEMTFEFREGPAFTNILLADEINRATPRTQSALLECMEEKQVTSDGETRALPEPFFVIATQNPIEIQGTFQLPEAQLDRFLVRLSMGYPEGNDAKALLDRFIDANPLQEISPVATTSELIDAQKSFSAVYVSEAVREYIVKLAEATRNSSDVSLGVSPRGMLAMLRASQAYAAVMGREYVLPDDIKQLAIPVFSHRIILKSGHGLASAKTAELITNILSSIPAPTEDPTVHDERG